MVREKSGCDVRCVDHLLVNLAAPVGQSKTWSDQPHGVDFLHDQLQYKIRMRSAKFFAGVLQVHHFPAHPSPRLFPQLRQPRSRCHDHIDPNRPYPVVSAFSPHEDYWELKNMTHLLLDLDTKDHVFDKDRTR